MLERRAGTRGNQLIDPLETRRDMSRFRPLHLMALAAILTLTACGGDGGTDPPDPPAPPANRAPQPVGSLGTLTMSVGLSVSVDVSPNFRDPDGDALSYAASSSDAGVVTASVVGSSVEVTGAMPGTATVTVTARDPGNLTATQQMGVTVNAPPELTDSIPPQTLAEGDTVTVDLADHFTDADGDEISYEAATSDAAVATVSVDGSTATIVGVAAGSATLTVTARDDFGDSATQEVGVTVEEANQAPQVAEAIPAQEVLPDGSTTLDLSGHFTDPDGDEISYEAETSDADVATVSIDGSNATITGVAAGTATLTFTASDPEGLSATQEAAVTVNTPPVPEGMIDTVTVTEGDAAMLVVSGYFSDADGDALSYEATSSDDDIATTSAADSTVTINSHAAGTATITITATDPRGASAMQEATVAVKTPPMPDSVPPTHDMVVGNHVELDFSTFFTDEDGDELTYMAVTSDAAVATASVDGSVVTTTAADAIEDSVGTVVTLTVTATDPGGLSAEQEAMVRVNAMVYDTLEGGITVDDSGQLIAPLVGALQQCFAVTGLPFGNQHITIHWSEWQRAAGDGWVTAPRTYRDGSGPLGYNICPVLDWPDRQAGTYRMVGNMTILTDTDTTGTGIKTYEDTVTATFRSPTFTNKPGSSPAQDASFSSLRSGQLDAAQPSRASLRSPVLPGPRFRPPPTAEARAASRVAQVRAKAQAALRPPAFTRSRGIAYRQRPSPGNLRKPT